MSQQAAAQTQLNDLSDTVTEDPPNQEPPPTLLATSNAHLGHIGYHLTALPSLYVYPIEVKLVNSQSTKLRSQKLRYKAIQSFLELEASPLNEHRHNIFIRLDHGKNIRDELIVPSINGKRTPAPLQDLLNKPFEMTLPDVQFQTETKDEVDGRSKGLPILCRILQGRYEAIRLGDPTYLRSLDVLIRCNANVKPRDNDKEAKEDDDAHSLYGLDKKFSKTTGETLETLLPDLTGTVAKAPLHGLKTIKIQVSHESELSYATEPPPVQPGSPDRVPAIVMNLDFELAPVLQTVPVIDVLLDLFGRSILGGSLAHECAAIKHTLLGLHMKVLYNTRLAAERDAQDEANCDGIAKTPPPCSPVRHVITEIRMPGEVEPFRIRTSEGKASTYSVTKYFDECKWTPSFILSFLR
jgi:hypothetical protein